MTPNWISQLLVNTHNSVHLPDIIRLRGTAGSCRLEWGETFGICIKSVGDCQKNDVILV